MEVGSLSIFRKIQDIDLRDREATNRGLMKCMEDQIPIGFLVKRKPKPGVEYDVLELGLVVDWRAEYFTIEGFSPGGHLTITDATIFTHVACNEKISFEMVAWDDMREIAGFDFGYGGPDPSACVRAFLLPAHVWRNNDLPVF